MGFDDLATLNTLLLSPCMKTVKLQHHARLQCQHQKKQSLDQRVGQDHLVKNIRDATHHIFQ